MKIYAPVKDFNGLRNNVRFVNGVGETDDANALAWFQSHGYKVPTVFDIADNCKTGNLIIEPKNDEIEIANDQIADEPDFDSMTADELRNWGRANGFGAKIRNTRNKEKLLEIIRG